MPKPKLITLPNPNLRAKSKRISVINDSVLKLVHDMEQATLDWESTRDHEVGVALAAVQLDSLQRVVVIRNNFEDKADRTFHAFINPVITKLEGEIEEDYEGCLSIQDIYGKVPRHTKIRIKALNLEGKEVRVKAEGFLARVLQHEIDHTNGIVFIDHIKDKKDGFYTLTKEGKLKPLNYEKDIRHNTLLW